MFSGLRQHWPLVVFTTSLSALVFLAGLTLGRLELPPSNLIQETIDAANDLRENGQAYVFGVPTRHLGLRRWAEDGLVISDPERIAPGVTFMTGLFGNTLGARLYAPDGTLIHEWPIDFFGVAPDQMRYQFDALIHGDHLYPNGDILTNLQGAGIVRTSVCGEILWRNRDATHHSVWVDDDGFVWTPIHSGYEASGFLPTPFRFDRVAKLDPETGERIDEIDLVAALAADHLEGLGLTNSVDTGDVMHLNDVEILSADMANAFPSFSPGDILLSSRHFNQLWILDGGSRRLKWWFNGPMLGQHDPDFQPDGTITVFDNRPEAGGGSRILRIDPETRHHEVLYDGTATNEFYSPYRGKHQVLENGNILITETDAGRVFEVTDHGEIVWSFVNGWDQTRVGWITSATRYPPEYATIGESRCGTP